MYYILYCYMSTYIIFNQTASGNKLYIMSNNIQNMSVFNHIFVQNENMSLDIRI